MGILDVENLAFTLLGYPMSYVELMGTVLYLWSVWLIVKRRLLTWPIGILSSILYMALFYQIRLYSDSVEQVYYLGTCCYGWWYWRRSPSRDGCSSEIRFSSARGILLALSVTAVLSMADGLFMSRIHLLWPKFFPEPASFPYVDALTTIMSFTAMWLMARKRIESWFYWIIVDVIGIGLYYIKEVRFVSLLYVVLLILAIKGCLGWIEVVRRPVDECP